MGNVSAENDDGLLWKIIGIVAALAAAFLVQKLIEGIWKAASGHELPEADDPDSDASIREIALAASLTGAASAIARGLAHRGTRRMALRAARSL